MAEGRRKFDEDFRQGAVRIVRETGKPIAQVATRWLWRSRSAAEPKRSPG
jgi:transposase-like protein